MQGFFYCSVQHRHMSLVGFFSMPFWLWGQVVNTDNRPKYWHTKGVGRLNHVQKIFGKGSKREAFWGWYMTSPCHVREKSLQIILLGILSNTRDLPGKCPGFQSPSSKKTNIFNYNNFLSNSISGMRRSLKSLSLFPSILLQRGIGSRQNPVT